MPNESDEIRVNLVRRYGRAIANMRQLVERRKLGLALGAGVSQSAGFPGWNEFLDRVTSQLSELGIDGGDLGSESEPMRAQILFSRYRQHQLNKLSNDNVEASQYEAIVATLWRDTLKEALYRDLDDLNNAVEHHAFLKELAILAFSVPVVVTYNFDDLLERALSTSDRRPSGTIGYYSAWGPNFVVQDERPVIYHPNGYIPEQAIDRYSEKVVLTEESLSDQIIDAVKGNYGLLLDYYTKSPCLFVGFSLSDPGLRSILRQSERRSPGTVHYYIRYCRDGLPPSDYIQEISEANFDLFNMVTLFLDQAEISELLRLIAVEDEDGFKDVFVQAGVPLVYRYYIAGPVSVGKTSVISKLQGLSIVDEWLRPRDSLIAKPHNQLTDEERSKVDDWILDQLRLKNGRFEDAKFGLHVMDRAPLDAFAFTDPDKYQEKAQRIHDVANAASSGTPREFRPGKLILLTGRAYDLVSRQKWRGRDSTEEYIAQQQTSLWDAYNAKDCGFVSHIETGGLDIQSVTKEVARRIFVENYDEFNFSKRLHQFRVG